MSLLHLPGRNKWPSGQGRCSHKELICSSWHENSVGRERERVAPDGEHGGAAQGMGADSVRHEPARLKHSHEAHMAQHSHPARHGARRSNTASAELGGVAKHGWQRGRWGCPSLQRHHWLFHKTPGQVVASDTLIVAVDVHYVQGRAVRSERSLHPVLCLSPSHFAEASRSPTYCERVSPTACSSACSLFWPAADYIGVWRCQL